jgi:hypothetical protein
MAHRRSQEFKGLVRRWLIDQVKDIVDEIDEIGVIGRRKNMSFKQRGGGLQGGYKDGLQPETLADGNWLVKQNQPVSKIETKSDTNIK